MENDAGRPRRVDIILGDGHGATCAPGLIALVEQTFHELNYTVRRNAPYSGGYITRSYGRPADNVHALQIEINRALYMDEKRIRRTPRIETVGQHMCMLAERLCRLGHEAVAA
jgi:N-formylglutamate amidohydrolase